MNPIVQEDFSETNPLEVQWAFYRVAGDGFGSSDVIADAQK